MPDEGRRIEVRDTVQGVGFRPWIYRLAREAGIVGRVRNDALGVTIEAFGGVDALEGFVRRLRGEAPPAAVVGEVRAEPIPLERVVGFEITPSAGGEGARLIGRVGAEDPGRLVLRTRIGSHRLLERLSGEQLPRIC